MRARCYLREGIVYIPTTGRVDEGFYRITEPVAVLPATDTEQLHRALAETFARDNPRVLAPKPSENSSPILLKYAGLKSWSAFVRNAHTWAIDEQDGQYEILGYRRDVPGGWTHDKSQDETFPPGTSADQVITRMIAILQDTTRQQ